MFVNEVTGKRAEEERAVQLNMDVYFVYCGKLFDP